MVNVTINQLTGHYMKAPVSQKFFFQSVRGNNNLIFGRRSAFFFRLLVNFHLLLYMLFFTYVHNCHLDPPSLNNNHIHLSCMILTVFSSCQPTDNSFKNPPPPSKPRKGNIYPLIFYTSLQVYNVKFCL